MSLSSRTSQPPRLKLTAAAQDIHPKHCGHVQTKKADRQNPQREGERKYVGCDRVGCTLLMDTWTLCFFLTDLLKKLDKDERGKLDFEMFMIGKLRVLMMKP